MSPAQLPVWTVRRPEARPTTGLALRAGRLQVRSGPAALPTTVRGRRELPTRERQGVPQLQAAAKLRARPMRARAPRRGVRAVARSSSAPARQARPEIPTLRVGPVSYPAEGQAPPASPTS